MYEKMQFMWHRCNVNLYIHEGCFQKRNKFVTTGVTNYSLLVNFEFIHHRPISVARGRRCPIIYDHTVLWFNDFRKNARKRFIVARLLTPLFEIDVSTPYVKNNELKMNVHSVAKFLKIHYKTTDIFEFSIFSKFLKIAKLQITVVPNKEKKIHKISKEQCNFYNISYRGSLRIFNEKKIQNKVPFYSKE